MVGDLAFRVRDLRLELELRLKFRIESWGY